MASYIPLDIVENIFLRLPVKSLLRFRCVSKASDDLISHPHFAKTQLHLQITQAQARIGICIVDSYRYDTGHKHDIATVRALIRDCETISEDKGGSGSESVPHVEIFKFFKSEVGALGSCNGLICLVDYNEKIALWNPSTRQCNLISGNPFRDGKHYYDFAFVYDSIKDDYKIIQTSTSILDDHETVVDVFSLKSQKWRRIEERPSSSNIYRYVTDCSTTFLHGAVHWVAWPKHKLEWVEIIMAFDVEKEEFRQMRIPRGLAVPLADLMVIGGCLCVHYPANRSKEEYWVMKEYGNESSWSMFSPYMTDKSWDLLCNVNHKHLLYVDKKDLVMFDDIKNRYKNIMPFAQRENGYNSIVPCSVYEATLFVESLVSPFP